MSQLSVNQAPIGAATSNAKPASTSRDGSGEGAFTDALGKAERGSHDQAEETGVASQRAEQVGHGSDGEARTPAAAEIGVPSKERVAVSAKRVSDSAMDGATVAQDRTLTGTRGDVAADKSKGGLVEAQSAGKGDESAQSGAAAFFAVMPFLAPRTGDGAGTAPVARTLDVAGVGRKNADRGAALQMATIMASGSTASGALDAVEQKVDAAVNAPLAGRGEALATDAKTAAIHPAMSGRDGGAQSMPPMSGAAPAMPAAGLPTGSESAKSQPLALPLDMGRAIVGESDLPASTRQIVTAHVTRATATAIPGQPVSVLRIQLQPAHLGQVNVTMRLSGEQVHVTLTPDSAAAARVLGSEQDAIATVLRSLGGSFTTADIDIAGDPFARAGTDDGAAPDAGARQGDGTRKEGNSSPAAGGRDGGVETADSLNVVTNQTPATGAGERIII